MSKLYKIMHQVAGAQRTVAVEARSVDEAQERFIDHMESIGAAHGTILSIRSA